MRLERIRHSPGAEWEKLSPDERAGLKEALTGIWENCERERLENAIQFFRSSQGPISWR